LLVVVVALDVVAASPLYTHTAQLAFNFKNYVSQQKFQALHANIRMQIHPKPPTTLLNWTHHDKIVCVDRCIVSFFPSFLFLYYSGLSWRP
jgi:hypothetical protein